MDIYIVWYGGVILVELPGWSLNLHHNVIYGYFLEVSSGMGYIACVQLVKLTFLISVFGI